MALCLTALAAIAVVPQSWGWYVADARFEHFWAPSRFLELHEHLWDPVRGFGRPATYFSPALGAFQSLLSGAGAPPWLAERLTHVAYLVIAAVGVVQLVRAFLPRLGWEHVVASVLYAFGPFAAQFLIPSGLFVHHAAAPWLVLALVRGARGDRWRWAGAFAIVLFSFGALNAANVVLAALPMAPAAAYLLWIDRSVTARDVWAWSWRAAVLVALVCAPAALVLVHSADVAQVNLATTELPSSVSRTTTWSESWRGLGFWLLYLSENGVLVRREAVAYLANPLVIVATFALPVGGLAALARSRWRPRLLFGAIAAVSLVVMVGENAVGGLPPLGRAFSEGMDESVILRGFRTTYKAGPGLAMGVAVLVGVAVAAGIRRGGRTRAVVGVAAVITVAIVGFPFWTGNLYSPVDRLRGVPDYWRAASDVVDSLPGDDRVLVLPGVTRARYRWGYAGDDILDALLERPHVSRQSLPQSTPQSADLIAAIDDRISGGDYVEGTLGPILRRLGIRYVLVRNDLRWQGTELPRPLALQGVRNDPDLRLLERFGRPGTNTAEPGFDDPATEAERALTPLELYEVEGGDERPPARVGPPLLVSGGGDGWYGLARTGLLDTAAPVRYTAPLSAADLRAALDEGGELVVTDSNRRRVVRTRATGTQSSHTLFDGEELERPAGDLFDVEGSQALATFPDALAITASAQSVSGADAVALRAASAFDGDPATAWMVPAGLDPRGQWLRVDLREEVELTEVALTPAGEGLGQRLAVVLLRFSDGPPVTVTLAPGTTVASFPRRVTTSLEVRVVSADPLAPTGFAEVAVPGLDLREIVRVPDDVSRTVAADDELADVLAESGAAYTFERRTAGSLVAEEHELRRAFTAFGDHVYDLRGWVRLARGTPDASVDALFGDAVGAVAVAPPGEVPARGTLAIDGDPSTSWTTVTGSDEQLTIRFPSQLVDRVELLVGVPELDEAVVELAVVTGEGDRATFATATVDTDDVRDCEVVVDELCLTRLEVAVPPTTATTTTISVQSVSTPAIELSIAEAFGGTVPLGTPTTPLSSCRPLLSIDGAVVEARILGTKAELLEGEPVPFASCAPVPLAAGTHVLDDVTSARGVVDGVFLRPERWRVGGPPAANGPEVRVVGQSATRMELEVTAPDGGWLLSGTGHDAGWTAEAAGRDLGAPTPVDTQSAWALSRREEPVTVVLEYGPQRLYEVAVALAAGGLVASGCLVVARRER